MMVQTALHGVLVDVSDRYAKYITSGCAVSRNNRAIQIAIAITFDKLDSQGCRAEPFRSLPDADYSAATRFDCGN